MMRFAVVIVVAVVAIRPALADDVPETLYSCRPAPGKITASFKPETTIRDLSVWLIGFTCKNVVLGAGVLKADAAVTIIAPAAMTQKQAVQLWIDAVEAAGFVVVQKPDSFVVKLGPSMAQRCVAVSDDATLAPRSIQPPASPPQPAAPAFDVDANVHRIDDTHAKVTRALVDYALANPMAIGSTMRVVPAMQDGKPSGFKLYAIRPSSIAAQLNLANGDTLVAVNDASLTTADSALDAYTKLRDAKQIVLDVIRRGKPLKLTIAIIAKLPF